MFKKKNHKICELYVNIHFQLKYTYHFYLFNYFYNVNKYHFYVSEVFKNINKKLIQINKKISMVKKLTKLWIWLLKMAGNKYMILNFKINLTIRQTKRWNFWIKSEGLAIGFNLSIISLHTSFTLSNQHFLDSLNVYKTWWRCTES